MSIVLLSNDLDVVLMREIYQNPYPQIMYHKEVLPESGPTAVLSMQVANHIINKIIEVGTQILKEHRFNKLVIPRTKDTCFSLIHSVLVSEFILQESPPDHINDDAEPVNQHPKHIVMHNFRTLIPWIIGVDITLVFKRSQSLIKKARLLMMTRRLKFCSWIRQIRLGVGPKNRSNAN